MKLVILDSETVVRNDDVSLESVTSLCDTTVYGFVENEKVAEAIGDADAVICNKCLITREVFEKCKNLHYVGLFATGYNNVDLDAANDYGAVVANVPSYSTDSVAQHTFALILDYFNKTSKYAASTARGDWINYKYFSYFYIPVYELSGKTIGIIGYGEIGKKVADIARAFGMNVVTYTRSPQKVTDGTKTVSLDQLMAVSDVITVHCPLNDGTKEMINRRTLSVCKPTALFVNTARGGVVNEKDLADALLNGIIAHASLDVLTYEPMRKDCPFRGLENVTLTPHIAWAPIETRRRLIEKVSQNLKAFIDGKPINQVNSGGNK